jgi:Ca2+-binding EF-hand superfamily protein
MKKLLLTAGVCGAAAAMAFAAQQNRGPEPGGPLGRIASAIDANHDGTISSAEIGSASAALKPLDANTDGRLTFDELRPAVGPNGPRGGRDGFGGEPRGRGEPAGPAGSPSAAADDLTDTLMAFDGNSDGTLSRAEVPERFQGLFDRADANKDGALTKDEIKASAHATVQQGAERGRGGREGGPRGGEGGRFGGRGRGGMMDPLLRALDADRDGALSEAEMANAPAALATLDVNGDGQLTGDEVRPARPQGREGRDGGRR